MRSSVMHTKQHYAVMEITIDTKTTKIFDGLYQPLLDWKDPVISAMRKCMMIYPLVVPSSAQFNADTAVPYRPGFKRHRGLQDRH
jgi:hypothetical protein